MTTSRARISKATVTSTKFTAPPRARCVEPDCTWSFPSVLRPEAITRREVTAEARGHALHMPGHLVDVISPQVTRFHASRD